MGLEKVIVKLAFKSCLNLVKFDGALQKIAEKFDVEGCPPKEELIALNTQKNQIQSALETIAKPISVLDKTATTIDTILTALDISIKIIKKLQQNFGVNLEHISNISSTRSRCTS